MLLADGALMNFRIVIGAGGTLQVSQQKPGADDGVVPYGHPFALEEPDAIHDVKV